MVLVKVLSLISGGGPAFPSAPSLCRQRTSCETRSPSPLGLADDLVTANLSLIFVAVINYRRLGNLLRTDAHLPHSSGDLGV